MTGEEERGNVLYRFSLLHPHIMSVPLAFVICNISLLLSACSLVLSFCTFRFQRSKTAIALHILDFACYRYIGLPPPATLLLQLLPFLPTTLSTLLSSSSHHICRQSIICSSQANNSQIFLFNILLCHQTLSYSDGRFDYFHFYCVFSNSCSTTLLYIVQITVLIIAVSKELFRIILKFKYNKNLFKKAYNIRVEKI